MPKEMYKTRWKNTSRSNGHTNTDSDILSSRENIFLWYCENKLMRISKIMANLLLPVISQPQAMKTTLELRQKDRPRVRTDMQPNIIAIPMNMATVENCDDAID